jgi:hypothetical protein
MSEFIRLANLCEKASRADREIDDAIGRALGARCGKFGYADEEETIAACYTGSLDAAVAVVPEGWFWQVGYTTSFQAWAKVYKTHPDHTTDGTDEFHANRPHYEPRPWTPILALCHAALRARATLPVTKAPA